MTNRRPSKRVPIPPPPPAVREPRVTFKRLETDTELRERVRNCLGKTLYGLGTQLDKECAIYGIMRRILDGEA
jgi:hypothetical protein